MTAFQLKKKTGISFTWNGMFWTFQNNSRSCSIHHYVKTNVKWKTNLRVIRATYIWLTGKKDAKQPLGEIMGFTEELTKRRRRPSLFNHTTAQQHYIIYMPSANIFLFVWSRSQKTIRNNYPPIVRSLASF
jgi:hypothetical protein